MLKALRIVIAALMVFASVLGCAPKPEVEDTGPGAADGAATPAGKDAATTTAPPGTTKDAAAPNNPVSSSD